MGESDCLVQPFSYATGVINGAQENPSHALGESISFGRFASESLAWERWSSFSYNRNRYVEEAKNFSRPGSVAQKKAFFEAHYKTIAARKAAALLEQANANANSIPEPEFGESGRDITAHDSQAMVSFSDAVLDEQLQIKASGTEADCAARDHLNDVAGDELEAGKVEEADPVTKSQVLSEKSMNFELPSRVGETQNYVKVTELELESSETLKPENPILKSSNSNKEGSALISKRKPADSVKYANGTSRFPSSPAKSSASRKENNAAPRFKSKSEVSAWMSKTKPAIPPSPAKPPPALHPRKEINSTPVRIKSTLDSWDRKRSTPKAQQISCNATPARQCNILTPSASQNIGNSRFADAASKASTNFSTPLGTPTAVSISDAAKHRLVTPQSETRRAKTPLHPLAIGSRTAGPKWHFPSPDCSSSSTAYRSKLEYPISTSPFSFKTEERAARRKEKLGKRLDAKEEHRVLLQTRFKEKAETELRKLRQSLCFKARPLPNFYKERRTPKDQTKKVSVNHSRSPSTGRPPNPCIVQRSTCLPPRKTSSSSSSGRVPGKNGQTNS